MILAGLVAGFGAFLFFFLACLITYRIVSSKVKRSIVKFVTSPDGKSPSSLASLVDVVAGVFGAQIAANLKAVFLGLQSVDAKNERRAVADSVLQGNPVLGAIMASFPGVGRRLRNNPAMAGLAAMVADKFSRPSPGGNGEVPVQFKLGG